MPLPYKGADTPLTDIQAARGRTDQRREGGSAWA
jgi:hypothetical protein